MGEDKKLAYVGRNIRFFRQTSGLSQSALEDMVGISKAQISRYEAGKVVPRDTTISKIAEALNIDVDTLYSPPRANRLDEIKALIECELIHAERNLKSDYPMPEELKAYAIGKAEALGWVLQLLEREVKE